MSSPAVSRTSGSRIALLVLPLAATLVLAGCVPAANPDESASPAVSDTPSEEPTETAGPAALPDLSGSELFTIDAVAGYDGARFHLVLTAYVPIETGTAEAEQVDAYFKEHGDTSGVFAAAVAADGPIQILDLEVEALDGDWPDGFLIPMSAGLPGLSAIVDIPSSNDAYYSNIEGVGTGTVLAALTGDAPVTVFDWDQLALTYGFEAAGPIGFDSCDITTTDHAADYPAIASWAQGFCTFGVGM
jgi:hypothetical protein